MALQQRFCSSAAAVSVMSERQTSFFPAASILSCSNSCRPLRVRCSSKLPELSGLNQCVKHEEMELSEIPEEMELPPLVASLAIPGLPPCQESVYADEALACIQKRWPFSWMQFHARVCNSMASFTHQSTVSCDRLTAISSLYTLVAYLDDILFDNLYTNVGIDRLSMNGPEGIRELIHRLDGLFRGEEPLQHPSSHILDEMVWQLGCDFRAMSNPEWFKLLADAVLEFYNTCSEDGHELESYTQMRIRNAGSLLGSLCIEFANNLFLPTEIREHPLVQALTMHTWVYNAYINDIFSYAKEQHEPHSRNLIKVFEERDDMPLPKAAWRAVNMTNAAAHGFMELEAQILCGEEELPWTPALSSYVRGLKEFMSGDLYWHSLSKRYRRRDSSFPELRDMNASFSPRAATYLNNKGYS